MKPKIYFAAKSFAYFLIVFLSTGLPSGDFLYSNPYEMNEGEEYIPDWKARWELARVLSYAGRLAESAIEYQKLLQESPGLLEAKIEYAHVLSRLAKKIEALNAINSIPLSMVTDSTILFMAQLYIETGDFRGAENLYTRYLEKNPGDDGARLKRAEVLSWLQKYEESLEEYRRILDKRPEDVQVRRKYALVLSWAGKFSEAATELKLTLDGRSAADNFYRNADRSEGKIKIENIIRTSSGGGIIVVQFDLINMQKAGIVQGYVIVEGIIDGPNRTVHTSFPVGAVEESGRITDYRNGDSFKIRNMKTVRAQLSGAGLEEFRRVIFHVYAENGNILLEEEIRLK